MTKKVLIFTPSLELGGAEKIMVTMANVLSKSMNVVLVVTSFNGPLHQSIHKEVQIIFYDKARLIKALRDILKTINKEKPDYIFSTHDNLNSYLLLIDRFHSAKTVVRLMASLESEYKKLNIFKRFFLKQFYENMYRKAKHIIAQCDEMKIDSIKKLRISPDKIHRIYNVVDHDVLKINNPFPQEFSKEKLNFITIGSLVHRKGHDILIKALKTLVNEFTDFHMFIIGEGPYRKYTEKLIQELNLEKFITLLGKQYPVSAYLEHSDLFIFPSRSEGFPNALLEACYYNLPYVSSDCAYGPKEILNLTNNGSLFKNEDAYNLYETIKRSLAKTKKNENKDFYFSMNRFRNNLLEYVNSIENGNT